MSHTARFGAEYIRAMIEGRIVHVGDVNTNATKAEVEQAIKECLGHERIVFSWPPQEEGQTHLS